MKQRQNANRIEGLTVALDGASVGPVREREEADMRTLTRQHQALTAWTMACFVGGVLTEALHLVL